MLKRFILSLFVLLAMFSFTAAAFAESFVVVSKIAPILDKPGGKYKKGSDGIEKADNIQDCIVYGNIVEAFPIKGKESAKWMLLKEDGEELGYIEKSALAPLPKYEKIEPERFWVKEDETQFFVLPAGDPITKFGSVGMPRGITLSGIGELKKGNDTWILLTFDSLIDAGSDTDGVGQRYAWAKEQDLIRLSKYTPDNSKADEKLIPSMVFNRQSGAGEHETVAIDDGAKNLILKNGFLLDHKPLIDQYFMKDDLIDLYSELSEISLLPKFITADFALHSFHLIFDRMLQEIEKECFYPRLDQLICQAPKMSTI